jgi:hypothetical protein
VTLGPDTGSPVVVDVLNAWERPKQNRLSHYGGMSVDGPGTVLCILDSELNPQANGYEIRTRDTISFGGQLWRVGEGGATRTTVNTVWECQVQKEVG